MKKPRTPGASLVLESPAIRSLPLVEFLVDAKAELFEWMVRSGRQVLGALLEEGRAAIDLWSAVCPSARAHRLARGFCAFRPS